MAGDSREGRLRAALHVPMAQDANGHVPIAATRSSSKSHPVSGRAALEVGARRVSTRRPVAPNAGVSVEALRRRAPRHSATSLPRHGCRWVARDQLVAAGRNREMQSRGKEHHDDPRAF